jgi:hypothetical protein
MEDLIYSARMTAGFVVFVSCVSAGVIILRLTP